MRAPIVPKSRPMSQCASAIGATIAQDLVGPRVRREVEVADGAAEERVAHRPADERELVAGVGEGRGEPGDGRRGREVAEALEGFGDALHGAPV